MSVQIKSLTNSSSVLGSLMPAANDDFNLIPLPNTVYRLYTAPAAKAAIVKSIRVTNIKSQTINITLYLNRPDADGRYRRRLLAPKNMTIPPNGACIDDSEITLEPGDSIEGECAQGNSVHYIISGMERDVT